MAELRKCRIAGCANAHDRELFCCRSHWGRLPSALRDAIWFAYRHAGVISVAYLQAAENAEAYLEHRQPRAMNTKEDQ